MKNANKKIGFKIRSARESKNITRDELAERMGVGKTKQIKQADINKTQRIQNPAFVRACGFDSRPRHC